MLLIIASQYGSSILFPSIFNSFLIDINTIGMIPDDSDDYHGPNDYEDFIGRIYLSEAHNTFAPHDHTVISRIMAD